MDPIEIFKTYLFQESHPSNVQSLALLNGKWMIHSANQNTYVPIETHRMYHQITRCIEEQKKRQSTFKCICGICSSVLLGKLYESLYSKIQFNDNKILEEAFNEPQTPKKSQNNYDSLTITFGKYKNKTFKEVFELDKAYCIWCIETTAIERSQGKSMTQMALFVQYSKSKFSAI